MTASKLSSKPWIRNRNNQEKGYGHTKSEQGAKLVGQFLLYRTLILFKQKFSFANIVIALDFAVLSVMRRSHRARGADPVAMFAWAI